MPQVLHRRIYAGRLDDARRAGLNACTLCGRCGPACPARIDLPAQFARARQELDLSGPSEKSDSPQTVGRPNNKQTGWTIRRIIPVWLIALTPLAAAKIVMAGQQMAIHILMSCLACLVVEYGFALLRKKRIWGGAIVAGAIFAIPLAPTVPLWMTAVGAMFGMIFGREIFGGLGRGLFHPAGLGWCFLMASYSGINFSLPLEGANLWPLPVCSREVVEWGIIYLLPLVFLCWMRMANIAAPAIFLVLTMILPSTYGDYHAKTYVMFAAIFVLADMPTSPATAFAKILTGAAVGLFALCSCYYGRDWDRPQMLFYLLLLVGVFNPLMDEAGIWLRSKFMRLSERPANAN